MTVFDLPHRDYSAIFGERKQKMPVNDNDFRTWRQDDSRYNMTQAFDEEHYPDAQYRYIKDSGCLIVALAIMVRMYGLEKEADYQKFNPWIFLQRAKAAGCFTKSADFILADITKLYPLEQFECVPYSRQAMIESRQNGYASILMVPGIHGPYHYVVPDQILPDDVSVIDNMFGKTRVSQYEKVFYIVHFRRIEKTDG